MIATANGRFYTIGADKLPGARGFGEPLGTMIDIEAGNDVMMLLPVVSGGRMLLAATTGKGFVCKMEDVVAETRKGRGVVTLKPGARLKVDADGSARQRRRSYAQGPICRGRRRQSQTGGVSAEEMPEIAKGQGVTLQRYKDGGLSDAICFRLSEGLSWTMGGEGNRTRTESDLTQWRVARGAAGRLPPQGFPRNNRFDIFKMR